MKKSPPTLSWAPDIKTTTPTITTKEDVEKNEEKRITQ